MSWIISSWHVGVAYHFLSLAVSDCSAKKYLHMAGITHSNAKSLMYATHAVCSQFIQSMRDDYT